MIENITSSSASLSLSEVIDRINTEENFTEFDFLFSDFNEPDVQRRYDIERLLKTLDITEDNYDPNLPVAYSAAFFFTNPIKQWAKDSVEPNNYLACVNSESFDKFGLQFLNDFGSQHLINKFKNGGIYQLTKSVQETAFCYFANKVLRLISDIEGGL